MNKKFNNLQELIDKTNILDFVTEKSLKEGSKIKKDLCLYDAEESFYDEYNEYNTYYFQTKSGSYYFNNQFINIHQSGIIIDCHCDCYDYFREDTCKHLAACFFHYANSLLWIDEEEKKQMIASDVLNLFAPNEKNLIKKEVDVELQLTCDGYYSNVKLLLGENKKYVLTSARFVNFKMAYYNQAGQVEFGKSFTYDSEIHYFNEESTKIIDAFFKYFESNYNKESNLKNLLRSIKDSRFIINNYKVDGIVYKFPFKSVLKKIDDVTSLNFDLSSWQFIIPNDYEYILSEGKVYHLKNKEQQLLKLLVNNHIDSIIIEDKNKEIFSKGLLNVVRNKITIDESVDDFVMPKVVQAQIYFDLRQNYINCEIKFKYDEIELDYFKNNDNIMRDLEYENNVINDILRYGFVIDDKKIILKDLELEVEFIENGLEQLAEKYLIYTTEKFKNINIKKKSSVSSMFGIGQDNILSYNFNLGDLKSDELVNIFKEIKNKKKYYRLKNGDILNLEDESLQELESLSEELELSDEEIIAGKGSVLKYRAIYLDSLKNTKYGIIETNNLFDDFITRFYQYKDCDLTLNKNELKVLRDYQLIGVKWLYNLSQTGFGGILADEMGLGKTIQVIYYLKQILINEQDALFLIVVPTSLAYNWEKELNTFAPEIKKIVSIGHKERRKNKLENSKDVNVFITTYGLLKEDEEIYQKMHFHTMIIDEAQNIKNTKAGVTKCVKSINSDVKFALTGTPLENSVLELWSIFDFIMPGYLANLTRFQSKYRIKDFTEDAEILIKGLSRQINPFILRRRKMDVTKELPEKLINDIYIDLDPEQKKLYVAELQRVKENIDKVIEEEGVNRIRFMILQLLMKLRQICIDPAIVYENYNGASNKMETLGNIVNEYIANNHRILIFSSFRTALKIVEEKLTKLKIKYYLIDGSVSSKKRMEMVEDFQNNDQVKVFLIMLKAGGTGLNLTEADVVIHLDLWWNPQVENQATDRAHRIGQKKIVEVIHLITKGTIEEKILELQNKKRMLSDKLIDGEIRDKNILSELTEEDIKNLLAYENE